MIEFKANNIGIAILIGGLSSRMGTPKENLIINNGCKQETFLEHLCTEFGEYKYRYISVNRGKAVDIKDYIIIRDIVDEIGPIGGIYSVLKKSEVDTLFFVACDMPKMTMKVSRVLYENWNKGPACVAMVDGKKQPLAGIYTKKCIPYIENQIIEHNYKLDVLLDAVECQMVDMSRYRDAFENINTRADYFNGGMNERL